MLNTPTLTIEGSTVPTMHITTVDIGPLISPEHQVSNEVFSNRISTPKSNFTPLRSH